MENKPPAKKSPIKILLISDSHVTSSGMAEVLRLVFGALIERYPSDYHIEQIGLFHVSAVSEPLWKIHPTAGMDSPNGRMIKSSDIDGVESYPGVLREFEPDLVFALNDPKNLRYLCAPAETRKHKLVFYVTLDSAPATGHEPDLSAADHVATMSEFARSALTARNANLAETPTSVIYSPADTQRFEPVSLSEKAEARNAVFPDWMPRDSFVLGWVGQNQWRKQVWQAYRVIQHLRFGGMIECQDCGRISLLDWDPVGKRFQAKRGPASESRPGFDFNSCGDCGSSNVIVGERFQDIYLWIHMPPDDPAATWPVEQLHRLYGLEPGRDIHYTEGRRFLRGIDPKNMPTLYQILDAVLYLSGGEGFGLPAWEAMCCATPTVYTDYSAHAEYLNAAGAGLPVSGVSVPHPGIGSICMIADLRQAIECALRLYRNPELGARLGRKGRDYVCRHDKTTQSERWHRLIQSLFANEEWASDLRT